MADYGRYNVTITLAWTYPGDDAEVDNYTVTATGAESGSLFFTTIETMAELTLQYNDEYTLSIAAINCAGNSDAATLNYIAS